MDSKGLSQVQIARAAGVSQATVSRALRRRAERRGAARNRLFTYVGIDEYSKPQQRDDAYKRIMAAFERIWDQSEDHANAIARVIDSLAHFRPKPRDDSEER